MTVKVYVEGGGDRKDLTSRCREGFRKFFENAGLTGRMPRIVACGGRRSAYEDFCIALRLAGADEFVALLIDSEDSVMDDIDPWVFLRSRKGDSWARPDGAGAGNVHLMVHSMESWFFRGQGCAEGLLRSGFPRKRPSGKPGHRGNPQGRCPECFGKCQPRHKKGCIQQGGSLLCNPCSN